MDKRSFFRQGLSFSLALLSCAPAIAQNAQGSVLTQLSSAFSGGQAVQQVALTGNATWHAGGLEDAGPVTLTASVNAGWGMQLQLSTLGARAESQSGNGEASACQWSLSDGVSHPVSETNCWKPTLWFLPALSLQTSFANPNVQVTDLGVGPLGLDGSSLRHLQSTVSFSDLSQPLSTEVSQQSLTDLGLDPNTMLPAVLCYSEVPDQGGNPVAIELHFSNYQTVNGVQIPFSIERYLNGALQLSITLSSAQIS